MRLIECKLKEWPVVLKQMISWGAVGGLVGAVLNSKASYDPSGKAELNGCAIGVLVAVFLVWVFKRARGTR